MNPRMLLAAGAALFLVACGGGAAPRADMCSSSTDQPIIDANLASAIRSSLGVSSRPTCADLASLTTLEAQGLNIASLTGLEFATNLEELNLNNNAVVSLGPLGELPNLRRVWRTTPCAMPPRWPGSLGSPAYRSPTTP